MKLCKNVSNFVVSVVTADGYVLKYLDALFCPCSDFICTVRPNNYSQGLCCVLAEWRSGLPWFAVYGRAWDFAHQYTCDIF